MLRVPTQHRSDIVRESQGIQQGEEVEQSRVVGVGEPGFYWDGIVCVNMNKTHEELKKKN